MIHSTTILAVRHRDRAVMAGDGQVTFGQTVVKQSARKIRRLYNDRILAGFRRLGRRLVRAVRALRSRSSSSIAATSSARPSSWPRTGARDRILRRLEAMLIVARQDVDVPAVGQRRSHRARRRHRGDRIGRPVRAGGGARRSRANTELDARAIAEKAMAIAGEICIYTNAQHRASKSCSCADLSARNARRRRPTSLTPRQIVAELDKYVVGQAAAKRAVAIALRNRMRRQKLPPELAEEIAPKNILMIGPTGVGKTEIARRLARLAQSPFIKVEASKFTEVGYVGRDVESMVRDLVELGVDMVREERLEEVRGEGASRTPRSGCSTCCCRRRGRSRRTRIRPRRATQQQQTRERLREQLRAGRLDERVVEIDVREKSFPSFEIIAGSSVEEIDINLKDMLPGLFQGKTKKRTREGARGARVPDAGRRAEADRHGQRGAHRGRARRAGRHHLPRRDRQDRRPRRQRTAPTSAAKACSATSCRSSKARPSTPSTAWCGPITSCSSPPARSTCRSRPT